MAQVSSQLKALAAARRMTVAVAVLAAFGSVQFAGTASAQEKKADPKAPPAAAQAAPKDAAGAAAQKQSAWVKLCEKAAFGGEDKNKDGKPDAKEEKDICLTHHERLDGNTGMVLVSAAIREVQGSDKKSLMVMVPLGMAIPAGVRAAVYTKEMWDKAAKNEQIDEKLLKPIDLKYSLCHAAGCTAETEATADMLNQMKGGGGVMVLAMNAAAKPIGFPVPLEGFNEAFTGKPIDNQEYAKARSQLMGQIRQRQQAALEKAKKDQEARKDAAKLLMDEVPKKGEAAAAPPKAAEKKKQ